MSKDKLRADIWEGWGLKIPAKQPDLHGSEFRELERERRHWLEKERMLLLLAKEESGLVEGNWDVRVSDKRIKELFLRYCRGTGGESNKRLHNFFVDGLSAGCSMRDWNVNIPSYIIPLPREPSPFTPDSFKALAQLSSQHEKFMASVSDKDFFARCDSYTANVQVGKGKPSVTPEQLQAGQLLFSAIVGGGLLDQSWITWFGRAISEGLVIEDGELWLELAQQMEEDDFDTSDDKIVRRRYFPDPLTGLLIIKWSRSQKVWPDCHLEPQKEVGFLVGCFLSSLEIPKKEQFSLSKLSKAASTRLALSGVPSFLITYASNGKTAPSLPATAWARLRHDLSCKDRKAHSLADPSASEKKIKTKKVRRSTRLPDQSAQYRKLYQALGKTESGYEPGIPAVKKAILRLLKTPESMSPILQALGHWSLNMLSKNRLCGTEVKRSSMATYLSSIGRDLVDFGGHYSSLALNYGDWVKLYEHVIDEAGELNHKAYRAERLREFHTFMVYSFNEVEDVEIADIATEDPKVNNNILTPKEYARARQALSAKGSFSKRTRRIQVLLLTLGYRCGLRRNEALGLLFDDLQDGTGLSGGYGLPSSRPELVIRNNRYRTIKSKKSIRRIPLAALLAESELAELLSWKQLRYGEMLEGKSRTELLFCVEGDGLSMLKGYDYIGAVQSAMRYVSGEQRLVFQNLRHSFVTILILRLLEDDWPGILPEKWGVTGAKCPDGIHEGLNLRQVLLGTENQNPSRRLLYVVSQLCGHLDPEETMSTYSHLLDYCKGYILQSVQPPLSSIQQAGILGITLGGIKKYRERHNLQRTETTCADLLRIAAKKMGRKTKNSVLQIMVKPKHIVALESDFMVPLYPSAVALYDIFRWIYQGKPIEQVAVKYNYDPARVEGWYSRALALAAIETGRGTSRLVSRINERKSSDYMVNSPTLIGLCPARPRKARDKSDSLHVFKGLLALYETDPELAINGLFIYFHSVTYRNSNPLILNDNDKQVFITFLRKIGVAKKRITISLFCNEDGASLAQRRYWARLLNLPLKQVFEEKQKRNNPSKAQYGRPMIVINNRDMPSTGLRFGLFMSAVVVAPEGSSGLFCEKLCGR